MIELSIINGRVLTPTGLVRADIGIDSGWIAAIDLGIPVAPEQIDAKGMLILPALIDIHVHFNDPGRADWEGAATGSRALAAGGGAMFFDMPLNSAPCTVNAEAFRAKQAALENESITDFALWGGIVPGNAGAMPELAECGCIGFKAFMADSGLPEFPRADDLTLYRAMQEAAWLGLPVAVHAENHEITSGMAREALAQGRKGVADYLRSRPVIAEVEAIERAAWMARETGAKLHIVHISSGRGVAAALEARARGTDISIETCAHYLYFSEYDMARIGAAAKCAPPLRPLSARDGLWEHLLVGNIDALASDHSPAPASMKISDDFFAIWGGIAGVQSTLPVLLDQGVVERELPWQQVARLTAGFAAERFQLRSKGGITLGADADLVLVDMQKSETLTDESLLNRHKISPYIGRKFRGRICRTIRRGETIFLDGAITAYGNGKMVRPKLTNYAKTGTHS